MRDDDWVLMRRCAAEVIAEARPWWPHAPEHARKQVAEPLTKLAQSIATMEDLGERFARPSAPLTQKSLMWACYRAAEAVRRNVPPDEHGADLWTAGARLAFATAGIKADLLG
jgi:hypothetical protein